jgi:hypothetical protein
LATFQSHFKCGIVGESQIAAKPKNGYILHERNLFQAAKIKD